MLNNHIIVEGEFSERYMLGKSWRFDVGAAPEAKSFSFNYDGAERFVKGLKLSHDDLWRLLNACDVSMRHDRSGQEQLAHILAQGKLAVYELPTVEQLAIWQDSTTITADRHRYSFAHPAIRLVTEARNWRRFRSTNEVEAFLANLALTQENIDDIVGIGANAYIWDSPNKRYNKLKQALLDGRLVVAQEPLSQQPRRKTEPAAEEDPAPATPKPVSLGPHQEPGYVPPAPVTQSAPEHVSAEPPQSLEECEQRLKKIRAQLTESKQYRPKYSGAELDTMAKEGTVAKERFIVSLQKKKADDQPVGFKRDSGRTTAWTTTFGLLENADTDPELICDLNGMPYDPAADYELVIIDQGEYYREDGAEHLVPTYDRLGQLGKREFAKTLSPEVIEAVLNPEYSQEYKEALAAYKETGGQPWEKRQVKKFVKTRFADDDVAKGKFRTRNEFNVEIGANEYFSGDGVTKTTGASPYGLPGNQNGNLEMILFEHNPETMADLEKRGAIKRVAAKSIIRIT